MTRPTADLCDEHDGLGVAEPVFRDFGGALAFGGPISTVRVGDDNSLVRDALAEPGGGRALVVDGGGSTRCALVGDRLAALARDNGWAGLLVNGCVRDSTQLAEIAVGLKALGTCPRKSVKRGEGERDVSVEFAGLRFAPGEWLYADADGVVVSPAELG